MSRPPRQRRALLLVLTASIATCIAQVDLPNIDFGALGTVGVVGSFAGLSFYDVENAAVSYAPTSVTIVSRSSTGELRQIGATNEGGNVSAMCQTPSGSLYIGGIFTSIHGVSASNIASYDPATDTFAALGAGLDGEVRALSCDDTTVYAGGDFNGPAGDAAFAGNVGMWSVATSSWAPLPFAGLNGPVETIMPSEDKRSLFFGGSFSTVFSNSSSSASLPSSNASASIPSLGSSLVPISLNASDYWASPTTYTSGFGRPEYTFCPRHGDGVGASWLLVDNAAGFFIARLYRPLRARGIRLGNTFYEGRGTRNFSVVSIPDNTVLELTYTSDPSDPASPLATCSDNCVLAHNESIPYQDFLFPEGTLMTGFQLNIFGWYGEGGGLHLLQLLSDGAYAYAVQTNNLAPCKNGLGALSGSTTATTGEWNSTEVVSTIPGTYEQVLAAYVEGGTAPSAAQTITWTPHVEASGAYQVFLVTPGCEQQDSCGQRTTVSVTVTPGGDVAEPQTTTIDQKVTQEATSLVYSGLLASSDSSEGGVVISLSLAQGGAPTSGQTYEMIADLVTLVANSTNGSTDLVAQRSQGFGLFEYPLVETGTFGDAVSNAASLNATSVLTNATGVDAVSFNLSAGAIVHAIVTVGSDSSTRLFVAGNFTYSDGQTTSANLISYTRDVVVGTPGGGLNGPVYSAVELDGFLYVAGDFGATANGTVTGLAGAARWQYGTADAAWESIGPAPYLGYNVRQLSVVNTSDNRTIAAVGSGERGFALFDPASSNWDRTQAGLVIGNLSTIGAASRSNASASVYLAGRILAVSESAAPGGAQLSREDGQPKLTSFDYELEASTSAPAAGPATAARRSKMNVVARALVSEVVSALSNRNGRRIEKRAPTNPTNVSLPSAIQASTTGQVLAGAFWKNDSTELMLLGGNFVAAGGIANAALYNVEEGSLSSLPGLAVTGSVTTMAVFEDRAWIGGSFSTATGREGLVTYDLKNSVVDDSQPGLRGYSGENATVNVISQRPGYDNQFIVAGTFSSAGSLTACQSICSWDATAKQWSALSAGLQGAVGSVEFAGNNADTLLAAGQFNLNSDTSYLAQWHFSNSTWTSIGDASAIPGPATAVTSDNGEADKIYVAGQSADGSAYLLYYNGTAWTDLNNGTLASGTVVQQLVFVPISSRHPSNDIMETNRMLLVSGDLRVKGTNASAALFDGAAWYPYLVSTSSTGSPGVISQLFYSVTNFNLSNLHRLSVGVVILISIAIALGVVFLLVLVGLLIALARRRDDSQYPGPPPDDRSTDGNSIKQERKGPTNLLATVGAATAVLLDGRNEKSTKHASPTAAATDYDADQDSLDDAGDMSFDSHIFDGGQSAARARYSFTKETEGELSVKSGEDLTVLDSSSSPDWFLVANSRGERGLMPSSYLA